MSLLSGLFTELEKVPAPRFVVTEIVARTDRILAVRLEQHQQPRIELAPARDKPTLVDHPTEIPSKLRASNQPQTMVTLPQIEEAHEQPQLFIQNAATGSPEWLVARNAFYHHLMPCRACHAPVGRYCAAGAELRQYYDQTPMM